MAVNLWASPSEQSKKDVLVEFRAGLMTYNPQTKMVDADKRKGLVQLKQSAEDHLIHFVWKDRTTGTEVFNLIIFPGDVTFRRVEEAKVGRVYLLEWKNTDKKYFFWLQEPKEDKDKENCDNLNKFINEPPQPAQAGGAGGVGAGGLGALGSALGGIDPAHLRQLLQAGGFGAMDPTQLMQLLTQGGEGGLSLGGRRGASGRTGGTTQPRQVPSTGAPAPSVPPPNSINSGTLQSILDGLMTQPTSQAQQSTQKQQQQPQPQPQSQPQPQPQQPPQPPQQEQQQPQQPPQQPPPQQPSSQAGVPQTEKKQDKEEKKEEEKKDKEQ